jgi:RHS repeat-associated protein
VKYLLDLQPGLAYVIGDSEGSHYLHAPRGIHAVDSGTGWTWPVQDALGSVRGYVGEHNAVLSNVNYSEYGIPSTPITGFAFTGEWRDAPGIQYHRARYLSPALGGWLSLDPWEGMAERIMSMNGYAWVEGNVPNMIDPIGAYACPEENLQAIVTACDELDQAVIRARNVGAFADGIESSLSAGMVDFSLLKTYIQDTFGFQIAAFSGEENNPIVDCVSISGRVGEQGVPAKLSLIRVAAALLHISATIKREVFGYNNQMLRDRLGTGSTIQLVSDTLIDVIRQDGSVVLLGRFRGKVPLRTDSMNGMCQGLGNNLVKKIKMDLPLLLDG